MADVTETAMWVMLLGARYNDDVNVGSACIGRDQLQMLVMVAAAQVKYR